MQRRCIHNESGDVDPVKAAETPVPRGSVSTKKRVVGEDGSPAQAKKVKRQSDVDQAYSHVQMHGGHGVLKPQLVKNGGPAYQAEMSTNASSDLQQEQQPPIDPNLFAMYPEQSSEATNGATYEEHHQYPYPSATEETPQPYHHGLPTPAQASTYQIPSLEQIANEVLVDMNGNDDPEARASAIAQQLIDRHHGQNQVHVNGNAVIATPLQNGDVDSKPEDGSVDSAVAFPSNAEETAGQSAAAVVIGHQEMDAEVDQAQPSIEANKEPTTPNLQHVDASPKAAMTNGDVSDLPLYKPPAPFVSPETSSKRQLNGVFKETSSTSPVRVEESVVTPLNKRKRDSTSSASGGGGVKSVKKAKVTVSDVGGEPEEEKSSLDLARMLQQEDLGLRRRSSRS